MTTDNPPSIYYTEESTYGIEPSIVPAPIAAFYIEMQKPAEHIPTIELDGGLNWYEMVVIVDGEDLTNQVIVVDVRVELDELTWVTIQLEDGDEIRGVLKQ